MIPAFFDESKPIDFKVSQQEKQAMQNPMELNIILEPMDHFTQEDESFLQKLISKKKKGESFRAVVLKNDMKLIGEEIMAHWYGIKGKDYIDYMNRYFDEKW